MIIKKSKYRYPGPKPFTIKDEDLFFGRDKEKSVLIDLIKTNRLTILFGRSGYGKSSLIHAGVVPFYKSENYKIIELRFQPFELNNINGNNLRDQAIKKLKKSYKNFQNGSELKDSKIYLEGIFPEDGTNSLWQYFKTLQWEASKEGFEGIIFILDQFEELFSFPIDQYRQFAQELSEIIYNRTPYKFQSSLNEKIKVKDKFIDENKFKIDFIKNELYSSFLIGIRSDRLYLLDELGDVIPTIFNNRYKLDYLSLNKIEEVVEKPALLKGNYTSPTFRYSKEVVEEIKNYFSTNKTNVIKNSIETFQLQIICQYIEKKVLDAPDQESNNLIITKKFISKEIDDIIKDYYEETIQSLSKEGNPEYNQINQLLTRYLIERKLIDNKTNSRICLDLTSIRPLGISDSILEEVVKSKIIRKEVNTVSGHSYELSHDTLVKPILSFANSNKLYNLDSLLYSYYSKAINKLKRKDKKFFNKELLPKMITLEGNLLLVNLDELSPKAQPIVQELTEQSILLKRSDLIILNEAFQDVLKKKQTEEHYNTQNKAKIAFFALILTFFVILVILLHNSYEKAINDATISFIQNNRIFNSSENPISSNQDRKLLALAELYNIIKQREDSIANLLEEPLINLFLANNYLGKKIKEPNLYPQKVKVNNKNQILIIYKPVSPTSQFIPIYSSGINDSIYNKRSYLNLNSGFEKKQSIGNQISSGSNLNNAKLQAYLYNSEGEKVISFPDIIDASFKANSAHLFLIKKDTLISYNEGIIKRIPLKFSHFNKNENYLIDIQSIDYKYIYAQLRTSFINNIPKVVINIRLDTNGNINHVKEVYNLNNTTKTCKLFGNNELCFRGSRIYLNNDSLDIKSPIYNINDILTSSSGDSIFVYSLDQLIVLDYNLSILSKYRSNNKQEQIYDIIPFSGPDYITFVNLNNPYLKNINTAKAESITRWIDKQEWRPLSSKERQEFKVKDPGVSYELVTYFNNISDSIFNFFSKAK